METRFQNFTKHHDEGDRVIKLEIPLNPQWLTSLECGDFEKTKLLMNCDTRLLEFDVKFSPSKHVVTVEKSETKNLPSFAKKDAPKSVKYSPCGNYLFMINNTSLFVYDVSSLLD